MTLRLHIESLSLEGVDVPRSQRPHQLQEALEAELVRLLMVNGVPELLRQEVDTEAADELDVGGKLILIDLGR